MSLFEKLWQTRLSLKKTELVFRMAFDQVKWTKGSQVIEREVKHFSYYQGTRMYHLVSAVRFLGDCLGIYLAHILHLFKADVTYGRVYQEQCMLLCKYLFK